MAGHRSVLLKPAVDALGVTPSGCYVDGTFGRGGHTREILRRLGPEGRVLAVDKDGEAIRHGRQVFGEDRRLVLKQGGFSRLDCWVEELGWMGAVDGLLLDLGVSSPQIDRSERGFSFLREGPLDMRMDPTQGQSAADWLAQAETDEIARVLWEYGEERFARRIARSIVRARQDSELRTTLQLAELISEAVPVKERHKHPATRSFQAIRIHVNDELDELRKVLRQSADILGRGGRLVVISFHSLEDRIVKRFMRDMSRGKTLPKGVPVKAEALQAGVFKVMGKPVRASQVELQANPRARSAIMRVAVKR